MPEAIRMARGPRPECEPGGGIQDHERGCGRGRPKPNPDPSAQADRGEQVERDLPPERGAVNRPVASAALEPNIASNAQGTASRNSLCETNWNHTGFRAGMRADGSSPRS